MDTLYDYYTQVLCSNEVTTASALFKLLVSALLGGAIGFERKRKGQVAGSRTFALISMGATLAMLVSAAIPQLYTSATSSDPARVAAQVISGIGFLGAGAIIKTKSSIRGVTTAAGIWVAAGIGLAVGIGLYAIAFIAMILILLTLIILDYYEHRFKFEWESNVIRMRLPIILDTIEEYRSFFKENDIRLHEWYLNYNYTETTTTIDFVVQMRGNSDIVRIFALLSAIRPTTNISLQNEMS